MTQITPEEIKRKVTETLGRYETDYQNPAKVLEHVADDVDFWIAGNAPVGGQKTKADVAAMITAMPTLAIGGMRITPRSFIIEGNRAAVEGDSHLKLKDGRVYANKYHWMFEFRDGKIVRWREYLDTAHVRDLIG